MSFSAKGFVLPTVLIFLHIFSLLGLSSLMNVSTLIKSRVHMWQREEAVMKANQILKRLEDRVATGDATCVIGKIVAAEMAKKPLSWWQSNTCHGNLYQIRYYYAVELLGSDACGVVLENDDNQKLIANYYRITLLALPDRTDTSKIRLQSTMITAITEVTSCQDKQHQVKIGRQMWREI